MSNASSSHTPVHGPRPTSGKIRTSHWLSLGGYILLLILLVMSTLLFPPPPETSLALVLGVKLLPLLILLPGMLQASARAHIWLCFVLLLYFTQTVLDLTKTEGTWLYGLMCGLTLIVFLSSMMHVHWSKKAAAAVG